MNPDPRIGKETEDGLELTCRQECPIEIAPAWRGGRRSLWRV
jgi:hypothetical protein